MQLNYKTVNDFFYLVLKIDLTFTGIFIQTNSPKSCVITKTSNNHKRTQTTSKPSANNCKATYKQTTTNYQQMTTNHQQTIKNNYKLPANHHKLPLNDHKRLPLHIKQKSWCFVSSSHTWQLPGPSRFWKT